MLSILWQSDLVKTVRSSYRTLQDQCVSPELKGMELYRASDLTLGQFLMRFCFTPNAKCVAPKW